ncbi:helix-turn-helix domain-containing protein [Streptomyces sp. WMMB 322]|uniref:winged helix-turn-helix transcriptional regulator n=1 Tax=Streptomyces sp. WMMB 322 TaxID=1286821 RepID=UPI0006E179F0|nr:helix-turn-helix domain-containing protein [Streptomyces sp. WMMB 322]SCK05802.1 transcriptional regulator, HxlR family [Streptomyces sp. WMMB 322]
MPGSTRSAPLTRAESDLLQALSARWTMHILLALYASDRSRRFGEIQKTVSGISNRVLSNRLADLENSGLVSRNVTATRPITITYRLTGIGQRVAAALTRLREVASTCGDM